MSSATHKCFGSLIKKEEEEKILLCKHIYIDTWVHLKVNVTIMYKDEYLCINIK